MSRVAVVTGGMSGIGWACARALAAQGHHVVSGTRRGGPGKDGIASLAVDVADARSVERFCDQVRTRHGTPEILVNAAGIYIEASLVAESMDHWHDQIAVNLTGPYLMTRALMPDMIAGEFGRIVNIASTAARAGYARYGGYAASKAGLAALSQVTAQEGAPHNVTCVSISPTWVETPMMDRSMQREAIRSGRDPALEKAALRDSNPQGRLVQPEEVAALVAFCCGEQAPALTCEDIQVNAGAAW